MKFKLYERAELCLPDFMMSEDQKPPAKHKIVLNDPSGRTQKAASPLIWILLLAVPVVPAFYLSLTHKADDVAALEAPQSGVLEISPDDAVSRRGRGGQILSERQVQAVQKAVSCDFKDWIGVRVEQNMLEALAGKGRPQRLLPPDTSYTDDYVPERVNFDLDENGIILRIWCG